MADDFAATVVDYRLRMAAASARVRQALIALAAPEIGKDAEALLIDALAELEAVPMHIPTPGARVVNGATGRPAQTAPNDADLDVLRALAAGLSHNGAARALGYKSDGSVYQRVKKLARMLGVPPKTEYVVAAAVERGWV